MIIGILKLILHIHDSFSLKEKRMVLRSFLTRLENNFNVSICQIGDQDKWQKISLAIVNVGNDKREVNSVLSKIINFVENFHNLTIIDYEMEMI